jgi:hypothetical protein
VSPQRSPGPPERGQAAVDYVAALVVVVAALGVAGLAADAAAIPRSVHHELLRALCVVRGGDCEQDRLPCPVDIGRREDAAGARILVFRVGQDKTLVREERSDGTIAVTVAYGRQAGLEIVNGVRLSVSLGRTAIGLGGELAASAVAASERGYTWLAHDARAADGLIGRLGISRDELEERVAAGRLPAPRLRYHHGGLAVRGEVFRSVGRRGASLALSSEDVAGSRVDTVTGRRTFYVQRTVEGALSLTGGPGRGGATGARRARERYAVTYDRGGRAVDLMVMTTGKYRGSLDLPARVQPAVAALAVPTGHARWYVEETHLDLTDPASLRVAAAFVAQLRHPGTVRFGAPAAVADALRRRLDAVAVVHARTYDADERRYGIAGSVGLDGIQIGGELSRTLEDSRLVAATTRGLDGVWRKRADCLGG